MILDESKKYTEADYFTLVKQLIVAPNLDEELQYARGYVLRPNPRFFVSMLLKVEEIRREAESSNEPKLLLALDNFETKLYEYTNIIPADLPDSILFDRDLVGWHLADNSKIGFQKEEWDNFQYYIQDKLSSISRTLELPFLEWCDKMLKRNYAKHKEICKNPTTCSTNQGYDKRIQYLTRLIEAATPMSIEPATLFNIEVPQSKGNKIQWLGTQRQLAELFAVLKKKGWIEKFEYDTIKECFTESNSIQQYLKPGTDKESGEDTYPEVFKPGYDERFYAIKKKSDK
ncbi:MAG: hypothetical protein JNJ57_06685 [Saprospiraceae bacterium]|nr:hypothetical protein [Saprospiraceae bacterium]